MEHILIIIFQILFMLASLLFRQGDRYVLGNKKVHTGTKILYFTIHAIAVILHFIFYNRITINIIVFASSCFIISCIMTISGIYCKKQYYKILRERILSLPDLNSMSDQDIRNYFIQEYDEVYFMDEIGKMVKKIEKDRS